MQIFTNTNIDFLGKTKLAAVLSCLTVAAGMIGIFTIGFNLGIDFQGGTEIELMRALKSALDPHNTLNPGKVI